LSAGILGIAVRGAQKVLVERAPTNGKPSPLERTHPLRKLIALVALAMVLPARGLADDRANTKDAELLVHKAVAFLKKEGKEKAFPVFDDAKGPFTYRDLYVFVLDTSGVMRAHGRKPELIGKDQLQKRNPQGKYYTREQLELAKAKGSGWNEYLFENPATGKVEHKVAYVELVGDLVVGCGAFKE
jgi:cytochrome c